MEFNTNHRPDTTTPPPAGRGDAYALVTSSIGDGMPIPEQLSMYDFRQLTMYFNDGDTNAVEKWATYLSLPVPANGSTHEREDGSQWAVYGVTVDDYPPLPGWTIRVCCRVDLPAVEAVAVTR